jgi:5'-methylthioadenosine phosphorylase
MIKVGIIGGSGLDDPTILKGGHEVSPNTKYGYPSSAITLGNIKGVEVALLARHGKQHTIPPTQVNNRANITALKEIGCTHIIASSAVGSLREEIKRGDLVVLDQFIDFTRRRHLTFFDEFEPHNAKHTGMADPFDENLRQLLISSLKELGFSYHPKGTVITVEGPRFSTRAESKMFRIWGADVINMSIAPEAALAGEAKIPYSAVAMSTDYDCWKHDEAPVTWDCI